MKTPDLVPLLASIAADLGIEMLVEPTWQRAAMLRFPNGKVRYLRMAVFDLNGAGATEIAKDKDWSAFFLAAHGYPVPKGRAFLAADFARRIEVDRGPTRAYDYARSLGWPVIIKPNSKSQGHGVSLVDSRRDFFPAVRAATKREDVFLVQRLYEGEDYRVVLLDGELISAYRRLPLSVTGDGSSTTDQLLDAKQRTFDQEGRDTTIRVDDRRIDIMLRRVGLKRDSVVPQGQTVTLLPNANLSAGGDAVDVTNDVHHDWHQLCAHIAAAMNLRYIGIDLITESPLKLPPTDYVVVEVNAAPGLDNYASVGPIQDAAVRQLYAAVLTALAAT